MIITYKLSEMVPKIKKLVILYILMARNELQRLKNILKGRKICYMIINQIWFSKGSIRKK